jgi:hypothetical protein
MRIGAGIEFTDSKPKIPISKECLPVWGFIPRIPRINTEPINTIGASAGITLPWAGITLSTSCFSITPEENNKRFNKRYVISWAL